MLPWSCNPACIADDMNIRCLPTVTLKSFVTLNRREDFLFCFFYLQRLQCNKDGVPPVIKELFTHIYTLGATHSQALIIHTLAHDQQGSFTCNTVFWFVSRTAKHFSKEETLRTWSVHHFRPRAHLVLWIIHSGGHLMCCLGQSDKSWKQ